MSHRSVPALAVGVTVCGALAAAPATARPQRPAAPGCVAHGPTALVLSGGGARGLAHLGVLHVLDSLGATPDLIVGTSMGAVVGAAYASGYNAREVDSLARSVPLALLFRAARRRPVPAVGVAAPLLVWEQTPTPPRRVVLASLAAQEARINAAIGRVLLRGNVLAHGDFDALPIPFRAVATDLADRSPVVIGHGDLARAVRASFAVPLLLDPERVGGRVLVDGGLAANVPVTIARRLGAARVIVSDVSTPYVDSAPPTDPGGVAGRLVSFLGGQPADSLGPEDVRIHPAVGDAGLLDFSPDAIARLVTAGAAAARPALAAARCFPRAARARAAWPAVWGRVTIAGVRPREARALTRGLGWVPGDSVRASTLARAVVAAGEAGRYRALWLTPGRAGDSLTLAVQPEPAPPMVAALGAAYDNDVGGRAWAGVGRRTGAGEVWGAVVAGGLRRSVQLGVTTPGGGAHGAVPVAWVQGADDYVRRFDAAHHLAGTSIVREVVGYVGVGVGLPSGWRVGGGIEMRGWRDPARGNVPGAGADPPPRATEPSHRGAVGGAVELARRTTAEDTTVRLRAVATSAYRLVAASAAGAWSAGPFTLGPRARVARGWGLPPQLAFSLGADEGFPGLRRGDRRGGGEALGALAVRRRVAGPLALDVEGAVGRVTDAVSGPASGGWISGVRAGIGVESPLGPLRAEYGRSSQGTGVALVRIGRAW